MKRKDNKKTHISYKHYYLYFVLYFSPRLVLPSGDSLVRLAAFRAGGAGAAHLVPAAPGGMHGGHQEGARRQRVAGANGVRPNGARGGASPDAPRAGRLLLRAARPQNQEHAQ